MANTAPVIPITPSKPSKLVFVLALFALVCAALVLVFLLVSYFQAITGNTKKGTFTIASCVRSGRSSSYNRATCNGGFVPDDGSKPTDVKGIDLLETAA